ncbi:TPA: hypothetical protein NBR25_000481 [Klebsiella michiganensis]|nr:hypothetical protein [Klebsiella michiganensis]
MNTEQVNELIQSLESAGELSIREQKYLDIMRWAVGVAGERDAALNAERVWEKTMMEACGEDGPASVASEIRALQVLRDTRIQALNSQVEQLAAENARYSMSAGHADQRMAESRAVRSALGFKPDADDVSPSDLVEAINQIVAELCVIRTAHPQPLGSAMDAAIDAFNAEEMPETGMLNAYFIMRDSIRIPTPATDRIYAGIKAEAKSHDLNAFISHYSAELDAHIESGGDQFDAKSVRLRSFIVGGRMFREKLRDEEKALALREGAK